MHVEPFVPRIFKRNCGGWIAVSGTDATLKIGVTAETEDEVRVAFDRAVHEWEQLLCVEPPATPKMEAEDQETPSALGG